jgi:hypothetical protein
MFVPDPGSKFFHPESKIPNPGSQIQGKKGTGSWIPDPRTGSATKNVSIFNPNMIRDGFPGFWIFSIQDPGVKKH